MSVLSRLAGVPAATIKHYVREGLLPQPESRTSRNMAFYDVGLVDRIQRIKSLQREQFLPLKIIKSVLDGGSAEPPDAVAAAAIERALDTMASRDVRTREELLTAGLPAAELSLFESLGLVSAVEVDGKQVFTGNDLALLRVLGRARKAGITREMLPAEILGHYARAIGELARIELELFRDGIIPRAGDDLERVTDVATHLSEQLIVLLRRKLLLPTLKALVEGQEISAPTKKPKKRRR